MQHICNTHAAYIQYACNVPAIHMHHTCNTPATHLQHTCNILVAYLLPCYQVRNQDDVCGMPCQESWCTHFHTHEYAPPYTHVYVPPYIFPYPCPCPGWRTRCAWCAVTLTCVADLAGIGRLHGHCRWFLFLLGEVLTFISLYHRCGCHRHVF